MNLGICSRYSRHEATYAAIRLANWTAQQGHDVSFFPATKPVHGLSAEWDRAAKKHSNTPFTDWCQAENLDAVLLTHVPKKILVSWLRDQGIAVYIFVLWHEIEPADQEVLAAVTRVLSPHHRGRLALARMGLKNISVIPWDTGAPLFCKPERYVISSPRIYLPLYDGIANRMERTVLDLAGRALLKFPAAMLTAAYSASTLSGAGRRRLTQLSRQFPQQVTLRRNPSLQERPCLFQKHDLTLWPTEYENTCMLGLDSLTMGTPVIAFKVPPVNECIKEDFAIGIDVQIANDNVLRLPRAVPDYAAMDEMLYHVLRDKDFLRGLQKNTMSGLSDRRRDFHLAMQQLFS